jgi:Glycosyl transferase family 90
LFHHETVTQDFFYDVMKPWVHYIPIQLDLSDLREKYDWAEANPQEVERISHSGTMLYQRLLSGEFMETVYLDLFMNYLSSVVEAYKASNETWDGIYAYYNQSLDVLQGGVCDDTSCTLEVLDGSTFNPVPWTI